MDRERWFGGNPIMVLLRLVLLSVVVGVVLSALGIHPSQILYHLRILAGRLYDMGFGAFHWVIQYFLLGAVIVFPVWLIGRLLGGRRK